MEIIISNKSSFTPHSWMNCSFAWVQLQRLLHLLLLWKHRPEPLVWLYGLLPLQAVGQLLFWIRPRWPLPRRMRNDSRLSERGRANASWSSEGPKPSPGSPQQSLILIWRWMFWFLPVIHRQHPGLSFISVWLTDWLLISKAERRRDVRPEWRWRLRSSSTELRVVECWQRYACYTW